MQTCIYCNPFGSPAIPVARLKGCKAKGSKCNRVDASYAIWELILIKIDSKIIPKLFLGT